MSARKNEGQKHQVVKTAQTEGSEGPFHGNTRADERALQATLFAQHAARLRYSIRTHQQLLHFNGLVPGIVHQVISAVSHTHDPAFIVDQI